MRFRIPKIGKKRPSLFTDEEIKEYGKPILLEGPATLKITPGPLPVEAQIFLRVMGEDLSGARDLLRDMPPLERAILLFYTEQIAGLVYEVMAQEEN